MDVESNYKGGETISGEETTVDWRGRPSDPKKHGGMKAAAFVLGLPLSLNSFGRTITIMIFNRCIET